eukprot:SAG31_NODE_37554_length_303_cov_0.764706_1_plen_96_part_01
MLHMHAAWEDVMVTKNLDNDYDAAKHREAGTSSTRRPGFNELLAKVEAGRESMVTRLMGYALSGQCADPVGTVVQVSKLTPNWRASFLLYQWANEY